MIRKMDMKAIILLLVVLLVAGTLLFAMCSGPSVERKQSDMQKSLTHISANVTQLENYIMEWKLVWQNVAIGQMSFEEGVKKLNDMSTGAQEVARLAADVETPKWLNSEARSEFDSMKRNVSLASNAMSIASKAGAQMLKSNKLTAADVGVMANYTKDATNYLNKTVTVINKFKDGYGIDAPKK